MSARVIKLLQREVKRKGVAVRSEREGIREAANKTLRRSLFTVKGRRLSFRHNCARYDEVPHSHCFDSCDKGNMTHSRGSASSCISGCCCVRLVYLGLLVRGDGAMCGRNARAWRTFGSCG